MATDNRRTVKRSASPPNNDDNVPRKIRSRDQAAIDGQNEVQTYAASGLKNTLHGDIYQLKLLLLCLERGLKNCDDFWLATEMVAAEKFDDVVYRYVDKESTELKQKSRYLQAKHTQNEKKRKICLSQLMNESGGDFSLQKYFIAYRKMKSHPELTESELEDIIVWTNIDFDCKKLPREQIQLKEVKKKDDLLHTEDVFKRTIRYKINIPRGSRLYEILRNSSDANVLAKTLAQHLRDRRKLTLRTNIFKLYHRALVSENIINIEQKWLSEEFMNNPTILSKSAQEFRITLIFKFYELKGDDRYAQLPLSNEILKVGSSRPTFSPRFGKKFEPLDDLKLSDSFTEAFLKLITDNENTKVVNINSRARKVIRTGIDKLAEHVLIAQNDTIKFSSNFLEGESVSDDIKAFRDQMKIRLKDKFNDLAKYQIKMRQSEFWNQMFAKTELPEFKSDDTKTLVRTLAHFLCNNSELTLHTKSFKLYHVVLVSENIIDLREKWLSHDFINNPETLQWSSAQEFQTALKSEFNNLQSADNYIAQSPLSDKILQPQGRPRPEFSVEFGKAFKPRNRKLSNVALFTEAFLGLISDNENEKVVKIDSTEHESTVIRTQIDKLAGRVLVAENRTIKFSPHFLNGGTMREDIQQFREKMKSSLNDKFKDLDQYQFEIVQSKYWNQLYAEDKLPKFESESTTTTDIENFSKKFIFAVNQLNEVELGELITREIAEWPDINQSEAGLVSDGLHRVLLDWFKKKGAKKGEEGEYLTAKQGEEMVNSIRRSIATSCLSRMSLRCLKQLQGYGLEFENELEELRDFLTASGNCNVNDRVLNIHAHGETLPTAIRVRQTILSIRKTQGFEKDNSMIFMLMSQNFLLVTKDIIRRAFESSDSPDLFVLEYEAADQKELQELCQILCKTMETNQRKKLIIITKSRAGGTQLDQYFLYHAEESYDSGFNNLTEASQQILLGQRSINLQGKPGMSFQALCGNPQSTEFRDVIDPSTFVKLIRNEEISVGRNQGSTHQRSPTTMAEDRQMDQNMRSIVIEITNTTIVTSRFKLTDSTRETEDEDFETWEKQIMEKDSNTWVIRINLNNFTKELDEKLIFGSCPKDNVNKAVDFCTTTLSGLESELEKRVLKTAINNGGNIALLFHGLALIHDDHQNKVTDMFKSLEGLVTVRLHIITTPETEELLKNNLDNRSQFSQNGNVAYGVGNDIPFRDFDE